jgi:TonB family protein
MRLFLSLSICILVSQWPAFGLDKAGLPNGKGNLKPSGKSNVEKDESGKDIDFGPYMQELQRRIKRAWFPPKGDETKRYIVVFEVNRDGSLSNLKLSKSSGDKAADQSGLVAVRNASPFQRLPPGSPEKVDIQFTFDYNVFRGSNGSYSSSGASIGNKHEELVKAGREAFLAKKYDV